MWLKLSRGSNLLFCSKKYKKTKEINPRTSIEMIKLPRKKCLEWWFEKKIRHIYFQIYFL